MFALCLYQHQSLLNAFGQVIAVRIRQMSRPLLITFPNRQSPFWNICIGFVYECVCLAKKSMSKEGDSSLPIALANGCTGLGTQVRVNEERRQLEYSSL